MWVLTWTGAVYPDPEVAPEEAAMGLLSLGASRGCRRVILRHLLALPLAKQEVGLKVWAAHFCLNLCIFLSSNGGLFACGPGKLPDPQSAVRVSLPNPMAQPLGPQHPGTGGTTGAGS